MDSSWDRPSPGSPRTERPLRSGSVGLGRGFLPLPALLATLLTPGCAGSGPSPEVALDPIRVPPPVASAGPLAPAAFLVGCWIGRSSGGGTVIEERWTPPRGGTMLATTRYLREGRTVGWEFSLLEIRDGVPVLVPHSGGRRSEHAFSATRSDPGALVFEAPEHDYPRRILYSGVSGEEIRILIDAGSDDPEPRSWVLERESCEGNTGM